MDGCPVITRDGIQQCGPAPLKAIKEGNVYLQFDAAFMFSCVNSDKATWLCQKTNAGETKILSLLKRNRHQVGSKIVTKSLSWLNIEEHTNVTSDYKHKEGTRTEEMAWERALTFVGLEDSFNRRKMQAELLETPSDIRISA